MTFSPLEERVAVKAKLDGKKEKKEKETKSFAFFLFCFTSSFNLKKELPCEQWFLQAGRYATKVSLP